MQMQRDTRALAGREFDLIIVGAGSFGTAAAWEAASRGLSVAVLEQGDFVQWTSNNHFRMVHGGIRYIQHLDVYRVRESAYERSALLRIAPHLVQPLPILIPTYGHAMQGAEVLFAGMNLYNLATFDRNRGINDPARRIPPARIISRRELLSIYPDVDSKGLTGAGLFSDGQIHNPARLGLSFLKSALGAGAVAANYMEARDFLRQGERITGVIARDSLSGEDIEVRGRMVLNTAGPWAARWLMEKLNTRLDPYPNFSRDTCFIVRRKLTDGVHALTVLGRTSDPDAILSRGHRHLFLVPWQDVTLVGVWHVVYDGKPEAFQVTEEELLSYIDEMNGAYPSARLSLSDVSRWMAGLTLFGEKQEGGENLSYGHRSQLIDHAERHRVEGLITLLGVRATTARGMSEKAIDMVFQKLGKGGPKSQTTTTPIYGGQIDDFARLVDQATRQRPPAVPAQAMPNLVQNHGAAYGEVLDYVRQDPCWGETLGASQTLKAEVVHAVRSEMALKLSDVVFRRTDLGGGGHPGEAALRDAGQIMARELGWDANRLQAELDAVKRIYPSY